MPGRSLSSTKRANDPAAPERGRRRHPLIAVRIRQHVNPLKSNFFRIPVAAPSLPGGVPLEVELGSAEAHFLMERATEEPGRRYVGVEIRREVSTAANAECARRGLYNVESVFANLSVDLPRLFPRASVSRFHLNFPDPWWKTRQRKRRVVSPALITELHALLAPAGEVHVATDVFAIALEAMAELETGDGFVSLAGSWSFLRHGPFAARSRRERQCQDEGARIWRLAYRKR
jgi:tRNA (guanine-N7-)-methyltransferase